MSQKYIVSQAAIDYLNGLRNELDLYCHTPGCRHKPECPGRHLPCKNRLDVLTAIAHTTDGSARSLSSILETLRRDEITRWSDVPNYKIMRINALFACFDEALNIVQLYMRYSTSKSKKPRELSNILYLLSEGKEVRKWKDDYQVEFVLRCC